MLKRRTLSGFLITALAFAASSMAVADRYHNQSGLAPGRFVWSPAVAPDGPLTVVVSPSERTAHVYRDGQEIGISTITVPADANSARGVFVLSQDGDVENAPASSNPVWRGTELYLGGDGHIPDDGVRARLPSDFAELLREATHQGAAIIVAPERSGPQLFSAPGPFVDPVETGSVSRVGRFARPELSQQLAPSEPSSPTEQDAAGASERAPERGTTGGHATSLILSRADQTAYVLKDGVITDRLPIAVEEPTKALGLHAAVLITPGDARREFKWLAFGIDEDPKAAHVVANEAEHAMRRVRFMDKGRSTNLARAMTAGTIVVLTDGHGPSATEAGRFNVALLQDEDAPQVMSSDARAGPAPPHDANDDDSPRASKALPERVQAAPSPASTSANRKLRSAASRSRSEKPTKRRRGPLDQREAWPNSIYWPY